MPPTPIAQADQPASRLPTAATAPRPKPVATVERRVAQPGDRICGSCGEANDPARKFCRRCGANLGEAKVVAQKPLPWWRRIFRRSPKAPKGYAAGERVGSMQAGAKVGGGLRGLLKARTILVTILGALAAIGLIGYVSVPSLKGTVDQALSGGIPGIVDKIQDFINPTPVIERPIRDELRASSEVEDHPVLSLFDRFTNTDWRGQGESPSVTATFASKVDMLSVIVYSGSAGEDFVDLRRPERLAFTFPDGSTTTITLEDIHDKQTFELKASGVDEVTITVVESYGPQDAPVSISEIEFFRKG